MALPLLPLLLVKFAAKFAAKKALAHHAAHQAARGVAHHSLAHKVVKDGTQKLANTAIDKATAPKEQPES